MKRVKKIAWKFSLTKVGHIFEVTFLQLSHQHVSTSSTLCNPVAWWCMLSPFVDKGGSHI